MSKPLSEYPNDAGFFGDYGGQYVSEILMPLIHELDQLFHHEVQTAEFQEQLRYYYQHYIGRPSPLYHAKRLTDHVAGLKSTLNEMN